ncbi:7-carboxy-7-deazaguanine synthase QueE [Phytohabitans sp. ZYX-F-186]|uniref:7-carboxy-7-deazaguanine synthase n=1 Tax=Phytohabitans maris TaxID=3071409 RepID=A0ABU0ZEB9_9ACTN|nr:7-carboxy-7-deazaguanine synthase QueE [Phytohabitans sp. ZYX-F-186]MDQ7904697.1 7-carboxy-7-deazaguanine synthase QueE [Phytohabitans sp. ZYX-F-186]
MTVDSSALPAWLRIAELFGPTVQGEGPSVGQRALFIRLSGCNLDCSWCDTPYTWDWSRFDQTAESRETAVAEIEGWVRVQGKDGDLVVITGGEPLMQRRGLVALVVALGGLGRRIEIETNGTIPPGPDLVAGVHRFNVSPKLTGSGVPEQRRIRPLALRSFRDCGKAVFKFVVTGDDDVAELAELQRRFGLTPVWVMPEGTTPESVLAGMRTLAAPALEHGWNLTPRLHVLLWGDERGR